MNGLLSPNRHSISRTPPSRGGRHDPSEQSPAVRNVWWSAACLWTSVRVRRPRAEDAMSDDTPITDDERARVEARHAGDGAVSDPLAEMIQARLGAEWRCAPA